MIPGGPRPTIDSFSSTRRSVAVLGAGAAGLTAAWLVAHKHDVTLFERETRLGGHVQTVIVPDGPDAGTAIDTGFIVFNPPNYPTYCTLLAKLGIEHQESDMSFSYHRVRDGFHYAGSGLNGLFSMRRNLVSPAFHRMLADLFLFNRAARRDLATGALEGRTLAEYVASLRVGREMRDWYLTPMASAIWSMPPADVLEFPASAFVRFFENHGLLRLTHQPKWRTVRGGSDRYVRAMMASFPGRVRTGAVVTSLARDDRGVIVTTPGAPPERFDHAIVATHADEALALLADPTPEERRLLGAWRYTRNEAVLHEDSSVLPPRRRAWASWNYEEEADAGAPSSEATPVCLHYSMNRLQRLTARRQYCVTLNRRRPVARDRVIRTIMYTHPRYDFASLATHSQLPGLNGLRHTSYCGSYFGWGFHEDAVASAAAVARRFGVEL